MMRKTSGAVALLALLVAAPASAQMGSVLMKTGAGAGTILRPAPFFNFTGAGISCAYDSVSSADKCTVAAGAGGTLQNAYDNSAGALPSIGLTAAGAGVTIRDNAVPIGGTLFGVQNSGGTVKFLDIPAAGTVNITSGAGVNTTALTLDTVSSYSGGSGGANLSVRNNTKVFFELYAGFPAAADSAISFASGNGGVQIGTLRAINLTTSLALGSFSDLSPVTDLTQASLGLATKRWNGVFTNAVSSGAAQALPITGSATSTWQVTSGNLTLSAAGNNLILAANGNTALTLAASGVNTSYALTGGAASSIVTTNATALTITSANTATWSTSAGTLTESGFAGINLQVNGTTVVDVGATTSTALTLAAGKSVAFGSKLLLVNTAPTISSGFGTGPSIANNNGTAAFTVNVGTGGTASSGVIGLPAATTGWNCYCNDITTQSATIDLCKQSASTTTTATIGNFNTTGVLAAWAASDIITVNCFAY